MRDLANTIFRFGKAADPSNDIFLSLRRGSVDRNTAAILRALKKAAGEAVGRELKLQLLPFRDTCPMQVIRLCWTPNYVVIGWQYMFSYY